MSIVNYVAGIKALCSLEGPAIKTATRFSLANHLLGWCLRYEGSAQNVASVLIEADDLAKPSFTRSDSTRLLNLIPDASNLDHPEFPLDRERPVVTTKARHIGTFCHRSPS